VLAQVARADMVAQFARVIGEICRRVPAMEDQVVAELDLGEEQPMLAAGLLSLACGKVGCETREPFLAAGHQIPWGERIGEFLEAFA
jgi:hypothetical protein